MVLVWCVVILAFGVCGSCLLGVWVYVLYEFVWVFGVVTGVWWVLGLCGVCGFLASCGWLRDTQFVGGVVWRFWRFVLFIV